MKIDLLKDVVNEPNYQVTSDGRVWSKRNKKFLKLQNDGRGYVLVSLGQKNSKSVHRLVFEAFYRRLLPNEDVHHINQIRDDNRVENLVAKDGAEHNSFHKKGKQTRLGSKWTQEQTQRHSEMMKEKWKNQQFRKNSIIKHTGHKHSQQTKRKMSEAHKKGVK